MDRRNSQVDTDGLAITVQMCVQGLPGMMQQRQSTHDPDAAEPVAVIPKQVIDAINAFMAALHSLETSAARSAFDGPVGNPPHLTQWPQYALALVRPVLCAIAAPC